MKKYKLTERPMKDKWMDDKEPLHPCISPQHNPPMLIYIPPGQTFVHTCPGCGEQMVLHSSNVTC